MAASLFVFRPSDTGVLVWVFAAVQVLIAVGYVVAWGVRPSLGTRRRRGRLMARNYVTDLRPLGLRRV
ncbi:putative enzyme [Mycolicibacterium brisbanense]|uniref:Putative enzyme n=1 Tax=Mycolicibacterium brisbanense TaxID=146020 RepID=A0A100W412_9MYCO|nr:putative enzyme [Mycolicibacterium brisbanense]